MISIGRDPEWYPVVAIPARNESLRLPALIEALYKQSWLCSRGRSLNIVIVLNNCDDDSASVVAAALALRPNLLVELIKVSFPEADAHVGSARRLAMDRALTLCSDPSRSVVLTTDADAVPSLDWIEANLRTIQAGADIVGGLIIGNKQEEALLGPKFSRRAARNLQYANLTDRLASLIDPLTHDPWPRHRDHTGASLAVRADVYAAVGGLPALPFREDIAFVGRVQAAGYRLRHALDVRVTVSARLDGRAPGGMADCLKAWVKAAEEEAPHLVEDPASVMAKLIIRRGCRPPCSINGIGPTDLAQHYDDASAVATQDALPAAPHDPDAESTMPIDAAISQIEGLITQQESESRAA